MGGGFGEAEVGRGLGGKDRDVGPGLADRAGTQPDDVVSAENTEGVMKRDTGEGAEIPHPSRDI